MTNKSYNMQFDTSLSIDEIVQQVTDLIEQDLPDVVRKMKEDDE